ncbi:MAG: TonB family protein, partial [Cyanobacteria bacterium P01_D01_bin.56]
SQGRKRSIVSPATLADAPPVDTPDSPARFGCRNCVRPDYPDAALSAEIEGSPIIAFEVNHHGDVIYAHVVRSSGSAELDWAALDAVMRSEFTAGGQGRIRTIEMIFSIEGSGRDRAARRRAERRSSTPLPTESLPPNHEISDSATLPSVTEENTELETLAEENSARVNVTVLFSVNTDGTVVTAVVTQSSGNSTLDQKVLQTVRQTTWTSSEDLVRSRRLEVGLPFYPDAEPMVINDEGLPKVEFEVDDNGNVIDARIVESSGNAALDEAALEAVRNSTFTPSNRP